ncbi:MAG: acetyl/propionyl-CoA carboxylase alpha subunit, partial [Bacteroidia bacterium]
MKVNTINTILIANRGEIASRIIRTCKKMGIRSVAIYSDSDRGAPYAREADQAVHIGGNELASSYLNQDKLISTAQKVGADAIHPGFGFLSENAGFAQKVQDAGLIFIGPRPEAIDAMGSKSKAKDIMRKHDVPVIPGYQGEDQSVERLSAEALKMGFPVLLKAAAGGGGKGMRIVESEKELKASIEGAKREGLSSFGNDELIIEKYFPTSRHIEFQIFGDQHGNAIHILERECSIQRRYQKIIEESPSPALTDALRSEMGEAAVKAAKSLNYDNAGTVEFILSDKNEFFFLEVNTRLQVEHPVTEEISGLDLVQMQIEVAEGRPLSVTQEDIKGNGYAIECRLYAEDAANDFMPATGTILKWATPEIDGLRIETGVESGSVISTHYDPMIAKLITHGKDRTEAQRKMSAALANL